MEPGANSEQDNHSPGKKSRGKRAAPLVESEVRRSSILKDSASGFKSDGCKNKKCLACNTKPPIIKKEVVKQLAFDFYKFTDSELNDELLQTKRKKTHPIARARIIIGESSLAPPIQENQGGQGADEGMDNGRMDN